jgi:hypothetical protein
MQAEQKSPRGVGSCCGERNALPSSILVSLTIGTPVPTWFWFTHPFAHFAVQHSIKLRSGRKRSPIRLRDNAVYIAPTGEPSQPTDGNLQGKESQSIRIE